jgi:hypothetical protein
LGQRATIRSTIRNVNWDNRRHRRTTILSLLLLAIMARSASAVPVVLHEGSLDPVFEDWALGTTGNVSTSSGIETTVSGTHAFRNVKDSQTEDGYSWAQYYQYFSPSLVELSGDWRLEAIVRVVDAPICPSCTDIGDVGVSVRDGLNYWSFYFSNAAAGPVSDRDDDGKGPQALLLSHPLDTRSDYHRYEIRFSQNGPGPTDDTADFLVDRAIVFNDVGRSGLWSTSPEDTGVFFGTATFLDRSGISEANWERVLFDDGSVPEPSAFFLLAPIFGLYALRPAARGRLRPHEPHPEPSALPLNDRNQVVL